MKFAKPLLKTSIYKDDKKSSSPRPLEEDACFSFCLRFASMACRLFFFGFFFFLLSCSPAPALETGDGVYAAAIGATGEPDGVFLLMVVVVVVVIAEDDAGIDWRVSSSSIFVDLTYAGCEPCK